MAARRSAKIIGDPDRYIRTVNGGKYQARPYNNGRRYDLGTFATPHAARAAIRKFMAGELTSKPRFVRRIHTREGSYFIAVVPLPAGDGKKRTTRIGGRYATAQEAQGAAIEYLDGTIGAEARAALMVRH